MHIADWFDYDYVSHAGELDFTQFLILENSILLFYLLEEIPYIIFVFFFTNCECWKCCIPVEIGCFHNKTYRMLFEFSVRRYSYNDCTPQGQGHSSSPENSVTEKSNVMEHMWIEIMQENNRSRGTCLERRSNFFFVLMWSVYFYLGDIYYAPVCCILYTVNYEKLRNSCPCT